MCLNNVPLSWPEVCDDCGETRRLWAGPPDSAYNDESKLPHESALDRRFREWRERRAREAQERHKMEQEIASFGRQLDAWNRGEIPQTWGWPE